MKRKTRKRNPYIYEYGYHATNGHNIKSILQKGLLVKENVDRRNRIFQFYEGISPNYFISMPYFSDKYHSKGLRDWASLYNRMLKVDVRKFEQLPDLFSLLERWRGFEETTIYYSSVDDSEPGITTLDEEKLEQFPLMKKWMKYYDYQIPLIDFKENKELATDTIISTQTFAIPENIPPKYIIEVINIK